MLADIDVFILPYAAADGNSLLNLLVRQFNNGNWTNFKAAIAFCKQSGTIQDLLDAMQAFAEGGGEIDITFGADAFGAETRGSDYEALETILTKFNDYPNVNIYLYHEKGRTFHPKIYLFSNEEDHRALLIVGSSNWSMGGLVDNIEVNIGVKLNLNEEDHLACYNKMIEHINDYWHEYQEEQEEE
jgi:phosphatidylserine/phosphatidylglycerophosphate/cardiolipin synthase-like enzyme